MNTTTDWREHKVRKTDECYVCDRCGRASGDGEGIYFEGDERVPCSLPGWEARFELWKSKYPSKTIGHHHYIRERNIRKFIAEVEKEAERRGRNMAATYIQYALDEPEQTRTRYDIIKAARTNAQS